MLLSIMSIAIKTLSILLERISGTRVFLRDLIRNKDLPLNSNW